MSNNELIEIHNCLFENAEQSLYRVSHNGKMRSLRIWNTPMKDETREQIFQLHFSDEDFPNSYHALNLGTLPALLLQDIPGIPIPAFQSSLSPRMVYDIAHQVVYAAERSSMGIAGMGSIFLTAKGNVLISMPTPLDIRYLNDPVLLVGWWILEKLGIGKSEPALRFLQEGNEQGYQAHLKQSMRSLELGLPNEQWVQSALQSLEAMCHYHPQQRWSPTTALQMLIAYRDQAIGLTIAAFCQQHVRIFEKSITHKGPRTGEVHPFEEWTLPQKRHAEWIEVLKMPEFRNEIVWSASGVFLGLHLITSLSRMLLTPSEPIATPPSISVVSLEVEHDGVQELSLYNERTTKLTTKLSRSKRNDSLNIDTGEYRLKVRNPQHEYSSFIVVDDNSRLECRQNEEADILCTFNNRRVQWE